MLEYSYCIPAIGTERDFLHIHDRLLPLLRIISNIINFTFSYYVLNQIELMVFLCFLSNNAFLRSRKTAEGTRVPLMRRVAVFSRHLDNSFLGRCGTPSAIKIHFRWVDQRMEIEGL